MLRKSPLDRVHQETLAIKTQNALMRDMAAKARELLRIPLPDTFLGRKTQLPFPKTEES